MVSVGLIKLITIVLISQWQTSHSTANICHWWKHWLAFCMSNCPLWKKVQWRNVFGFGNSGLNSTVCISFAPGSSLHMNPALCRLISIVSKLRELSVTFDGCSLISTHSINKTFLWKCLFLIHMSLTFRVTKSMSVSSHMVGYFFFPTWDTVTCYASLDSESSWPVASRVRLRSGLEAS